MYLGMANFNTLLLDSVLLKLAIPKYINGMDNGIKQLHFLIIPLPNGLAAKGHNA